MLMRSRPHHTNMGYRDPNMIRTAVFSDSGHCSSGPTAVAAQLKDRMRSPISPPLSTALLHGPLSGPGLITFASYLSDERDVFVPEDSPCSHSAQIFPLYWAEFRGLATAGMHRECCLGQPRAWPSIRSRIEFGVHKSEPILWGATAGHTVYHFCAKAFRRPSGS